MKKYIIVWNTGYGDSAIVEEHPNQKAADASAYENWREEAENNADYSAQEWTRELARDHNLLDDDDEDEDPA